MYASSSRFQWGQSHGSITKAQLPTLTATSGHGAGASWAASGSQAPTWVVVGIGRILRAMIFWYSSHHSGWICWWIEIVSVKNLRKLPQNLPEPVEEIQHDQQAPLPVAFQSCTHGCSAHRVTYIAHLSTWEIPLWGFSRKSRGHRLSVSWPIYIYNIAYTGSHIFIQPHPWKFATSRKHSVGPGENKK